MGYFPWSLLLKSLKLAPPEIIKTFRSKAAAARSSQQLLLFIAINICSQLLKLNILSIIQTGLDRGSTTNQMTLFKSKTKIRAIFFYRVDVGISRLSFAKVFSRALSDSHDLFKSCSQQVNKSQQQVNNKNPRYIFLHCGRRNQ